MRDWDCSSERGEKDQSSSKRRIHLSRLNWRVLLRQECLREVPRAFSAILCSFIEKVHKTHFAGISLFLPARPANPTVMVLHLTCIRGGVMWREGSILRLITLLQADLFFRYTRHSRCKSSP
jgi:hypothetical protein